MLRAGAAAGTAAALAGAGIFAAGTAGAATTAGSVPFLHREHHLPGCRLGVAFSGWAAVNDFFTPYFASLPAAIAYPLRMVGDARSAAIEFVDIPAFLGFEIRALYSVAFDGNQKIIRWVDYWDGRSSLRQNAIAGDYPADFSDSRQNADPAVLAQPRPPDPGWDATCRRLLASYLAGLGSAAPGN